MSLKETGFTFAEQQNDFGEFQEEGEEIPLCLQQPTERHIWDGGRGNWLWHG